MIIRLNLTFLTFLNTKIYSDNFYIEDFSFLSLFPKLEYLGTVFEINSFLLSFISLEVGNHQQEETSGFPDFFKLLN